MVWLCLYKIQNNLKENHENECAILENMQWLSRGEQASSLSKSLIWFYEIQIPKLQFPYGSWEGNYIEGLWLEDFSQGMDSRYLEIFNSRPQI